MGSLYWTGGTTAVAQIDSLTPGGTIEVGDKFLITMTAEDGSTTQTITVAATGTTVAQVCADVTTAFNASTNTLFTPITASNQTTFIRLTADSSGVPFYCTVTTTESDDSPADAQTFVRASVTANVGPNDWNTAANWSSGAKPVNSDDVVIDELGLYDITYGLNQGSLALTTLRIKLSFLFDIGTASYPLKLGATTWSYGEAPTSGVSTVGSGRIKLTFGTAQHTGTVYATGTSTPDDTGKAQLQITGGTHASNKLYVVGAARVDVATGTGQTATLSQVDVSGSGATVTLGSGVTWTTATCAAGTLYLNSSGTTLTTSSGGTAYTFGSAATLTTVNGGGQTYLNSRGTISTLNIYNTGRADFSQNPTAVTVTTLNHYGGGTLVFNAATPNHVSIGTYNRVNAGTLTAS